MSKFLDLLAGIPPFIIPIPDIEIEHYGASTGGHSAQVETAPHVSIQNVVDAVEKKTMLSGWIISLGFPQTKTNGRMVWVLFRPGSK